MKRYLTLLAVLWLYACAKEPLYIPCKLPECSDTITIKKEGLELKWQKSLRLDNNYSPRNRILITEKNISFLYDYIENEKVLFIDKKDTLISTRFSSNTGGIMNVFYHKEVGLIIVDYKSVFTGYDAASMKKIASAPEGMQFGALYTLFGDDIYGRMRDEANKRTIIFKLNVFTGELTEDKEVKDSECPECESIVVNVPSLFRLRNGDIFIIYNTLYVIKSQIEYERKIDAYLLKGEIKELKWTSDKSSKGCYEASTVIYNDQFIILSDSIYSMDPYTSKINWSKPVTTGLDGWAISNTKYIFKDNKIYVLNQGHFIEINADNGLISYDSGELFFQQSNSALTYFDGIFYWTAAQGGISWIFGLRASDKKVVLKMKSPNQGKAPYYNDTNYDWNGLQIDPEARLGYTADGFFAQCFRIPESYE